MLALVLAFPAYGWGPKGHQIIAVAAVRDLPASLPAFIRRGWVTLRFLTNEPDRWREAGMPELDADNAPDHFINLERVAFLKAWPRNRYGFIAALCAQAQKLRQAGHPRAAAALAPAKVGLQPYAALEYYQRLVIAMQEYRWALRHHQNARLLQGHVLEMMGLLSHFVGDGSQPLHTTIQYNGWVGPDPRGFTRSHRIHWQFESKFVNAAVPWSALRGRLRPPQRLHHLFAAYLHYLGQTHAQVIPLYELAKQGAFQGRGTAAGRRFVEARLAAGAQMLADMWYTAWRTSARMPRHGFHLSLNQRGYRRKY